MVPLKIYLDSCLRVEEQLSSELLTVDSCKDATLIQIDIYSVQPILARGGHLPDHFGEIL